MLFWSLDMELGRNYPPLPPITHIWYRFRNKNISRPLLLPPVRPPLPVRRAGQPGARCHWRADNTRCAGRAHGRQPPPQQLRGGARVDGMLPCQAAHGGPPLPPHWGCAYVDGALPLPATCGRLPTATASGLRERGREQGAARASPWSAAGPGCARADAAAASPGYARVRGLRLR